MTKERLIEILKVEIGLSGRPELECFGSAADTILEEIEPDYQFEGVGFCSKGLTPEIVNALYEKFKDKKVLISVKEIK